MKFYLKLLFILSISCYSQQNTKYYYYINLSDKYINVDFTKSLLFAQQALQEAEKENNSYAKAESYYYIAKSYIFFRNFEKGREYLDKGQSEKATKNDSQLRSLFLILEGAYYGRMSLIEKYQDNNNKALKLIKEDENTESKLMKANIYGNLADSYSELKIYDSAHYYSDKSINTIEEISSSKYLLSKRIYKNKPFIYFNKSWILLQQNKYEEAHYYIKKAYNQAKLEKIDYMALFYEIYGDYYYHIENYKEAIVYYKLSSKNKKKFNQNSAYLDSKIAKSYKEFNDTKNENHYLKKSKEQFILDRESDNKIIKNEFNRLSNSFENEKKIRNQKNLIIIFSIIGFFIFFTISIGIRSKKIRRKKRLIINNQNIELKNNILIIKQNEKRIEELKKESDNFFLELTTLFVEKSPIYWGRFQEIHPDFCSKILKKNNTLKKSELMFCSYIYLGYSNKEIANYTFKSIRTIENNRYNLRKKINLNTEIDFTLWLRNL